MTSLDLNRGLSATDVSIGRRELRARPERLTLPGPSPLEWARRRREQKETRRVEGVRNRTMGRLRGLANEWHLIEAPALGLGARDAFLAIGPGGVFAVTVKSQGRNRVRLSGDVIQIAGKRPTYVVEALKLSNAISEALTHTAGTHVPVTPVLALAGSGMITVYGVPRNVVVMPYRELENLFRAYGERISTRTADKLASVARHPATVVDLRSAMSPSR